MKRQAITPQMKIECLLIRHDILCGECGDIIVPGEDIQWDHIHALVHGGAHTSANLRPMHGRCHLEKTKRDISANSKVKRLRNPKPSKRPMRSSGRKIPSRPFPKLANSRDSAT